MSAPSSQIRLLLVEDVPEVVRYVRGLLEGQARIKLVDVATDGRKAIDYAKQLRPDVLVVDALLQGRVKGNEIGPRLRSAGIDIPIVALTVPQTPVPADPQAGVFKVLTMPFGGSELVSQIRAAYEEHRSATDEAGSRVYSVFAPKGGVGKTTMALNLAVASHESNRQKTVLMDGDLQFGDLRSLLKVPTNAPSIVDLPTGSLEATDLERVLWRDPSGIDILLAPPRVEMAEMITARDLGKILSVLRTLYQVVVIDTPAALDDVVLAYLDASDAVIQIVTADRTALHHTRSLVGTFQAIGYGPEKIRYLSNRSDSRGAGQRSLIEHLGRVPDFTVADDARLVADSNDQGVPFVLAAPGAQVTRDVVRIAASLAAPVTHAVGTTR